MARNSLTARIDALFRRARWEEARKLLEAAREQAPDDHWVLTQLGVTFYEQEKYRETLRLILAALKIVPDCPLALWNLAGALDALGNSAAAVRIYTWLLASKKSAANDPCWETRAWADALKTDCLYRLGVSFQHLGKKAEAERCYRQYLNLLLGGARGTYALDDVARQIRGLHGAGKNGAVSGQLRKAMAAALQALGIEPGEAAQGPPPQFDEAELLGGRRAASTARAGT